MADWPTLEEYKQVVNVDLEVDNWSTTLQRNLDAAINYVKHDIGEWDEFVDEPSASQAGAALRMAELLAERPEAAPAAAADDPTYRRLMFGNHKRYAIS